MEVGFCHRRNRRLRGCAGCGLGDDSRLTSILSNGSGLFIVTYGGYFGRFRAISRPSYSRFLGFTTSRKGGIANDTGFSFLYGGVRAREGLRSLVPRNARGMMMVSYNLNVRAITSLTNGPMITTDGALGCENRRNVTLAGGDYSTYTRYCLGVAKNIYPVISYSGDLIGKRYNKTGGKGYRMSPGGSYT